MVAAAAEPVEELRRLELSKLDSLPVLACNVLDAEHPLVSAGRAISLENNR